MLKRGRCASGGVLSVDAETVDFVLDAAGFVVLEAVFVEVRGLLSVSWAAALLLLFTPLGALESAEARDAEEERPPPDSTNSRRPVVRTSLAGGSILFFALALALLLELDSVPLLDLDDPS
jgi:hypothetical protein